MNRSLFERAYGMLFSLKREALDFNVLYEALLREDRPDWLVSAVLDHEQEQVMSLLMGVPDLPEEVEAVLYSRLFSKAGTDTLKYYASQVMLPERAYYMLARAGDAGVLFSVMKNPVVSGQVKLYCLSRMYSFAGVEKEHMSVISADDVEFCLNKDIKDFHVYSKSRFSPKNSKWLTFFLDSLSADADTVSRLVRWGEHENRFIFKPSLLKYDLSEEQMIILFEDMIEGVNAGHFKRALDAGYVYEVLEDERLPAEALLNDAVLSGGSELVGFYEEIVQSGVLDKKLLDLFKDENSNTYLPVEWVRKMFISSVSTVKKDDKFAV